MFNCAKSFTVGSCGPPYVSFELAKGGEGLKFPKCTGTSEAVQAAAYKEDVQDGSKNCIDNDAKEVGEEVSAVQGEGGIKDDWGQEAVEEQSWCQLEKCLFFFSYASGAQDRTNNDSKNYEENRLRKDREVGNLVEVNVDEGSKDESDGDSNVEFVLSPSPGSQVDASMMLIMLLLPFNLFALIVVVLITSGHQCF